MNEKEAKKIIADILGDNLVCVSISSVGRRFYASVEYCDYKPERVTRNEIEEAVPNLIVNDIVRDYSREHVANAILNDSTTIYIESVNDRLDKTTVQAYVYELMFDMDFSK